IRPSTGTLYSEDFNLELARNSSAAPQSRFSRSVVLAGIGMVGGGRSTVPLLRESTVYRFGLRCAAGTRRGGLRRAWQDESCPTLPTGQEAGPTGARTSQAAPLGSGKRAAEEGFQTRKALGGG